MRSIRARLTALYAFSATVTLACLFTVGYIFLESRLVHGLDLLNAAQFAQLEAHLGKDYGAITPQVLDKRIRETTEYASVLFYTNVQSRKTRGLFYSSNLHGQIIPDVPGEKNYNTEVPGIGPLRVSEFVTQPFDVVIGTPLGPVQSVMKNYVEVCVALLVLMLVSSIAVGFGLSHVMLRPIRLIRETAMHIGSDNLSARIEVSDVRDEISDLARLLNQMFDRLEASFDQTRRFAAEASHELKTPLSLIRLHAEKLLVDGGLPPDREEAVLVQLEEISRLNKFIDELLFLSRAEAHAITLNSRKQDPIRLVESFQQDAAALSEHHGKRFICTHDGQGLVDIEEHWMRRVLLNLLSNALAASPVGGTITVTSVLGDNLWRVSVEDQGIGVPVDQHARIFERFVRLSALDAEEKGSGLGLAICRSIIEMHKGRIFAATGANGVGLKVSFELPAETAAHQSAAVHQRWLEPPL